VEVTGSFKASMGCRSFLSKWENAKGEEQHSGRTNLGVVTINPVMVAVEAKGNTGEFFKLLDHQLDLAKQVCEFRLKYLSTVKAKSAPILYCEGALMRIDPEDYVLPHLLERGSSISIGYIGLNEMANAMYPESTHLFDNEIKQKFILDTITYINNYTELLKSQTGVGYSTYGTPSESQCKRMRDCIYNKYGEVQGVTDKEYLTNSFHLEAGKQTDVYSRMDFEAKYVKYSSGGFISYGELPSMKNNLEALENIWDYSYNVTPYYAINTPSDKCFECNFKGTLKSTSKGFCCPICDNSNPNMLYAIRRVSGYLGNPHKRMFNSGKTKECQDRVLNL
jgi:ribonucleoside-triphosphate reductase